MPIWRIAVFNDEDTVRGEGMLKLILGAIALASVPSSLAAQGLNGITVDQPIERGKCGIGKSGDARFMICRSGDGKLVNEGQIRETPPESKSVKAPPNTTQSPATPPKNLNEPAIVIPDTGTGSLRSQPPTQRRVEIVQDVTIDDLGLDETVQKIGDMNISGCAVFSKWRSDFNVEAWNRKAPESAIFAESEFRLPVFLSDERTKELFDVPFSQWSPNQRITVSNRASSCRSDANGLRYKLSNEAGAARYELSNGRTTPAAATRKANLARVAESHAVDTAIFVNNLDGWYRTLDQRKEITSRIEAAFEQLSKAPLEPRLLSSALAVTEQRGLVGFGGDFYHLRRFSPSEIKAYYDQFLAWRESAISAAVRPVVEAVAGAEATIAGLTRIRTAMDANAVFVTLRRLAPENEAVAKILRDISSISEKVQTEALNAFNAKVSAAPDTISGAYSIDASAYEMRLAKLPIPVADLANAEDKFFRILRSAFKRFSDEVASAEPSSYRDLTKLYSKFDASEFLNGRPGTPPSFDMNKVQSELNLIKKTLDAKLNALAVKFLADFTRDVSALPNDANGKQRLTELSEPVLKFFGNDFGGAYQKVVAAKSAAIDVAIEDAECLTTIKKAGLSSSDGSLTVPTLKGSAPISRFVCKLMKNGVAVTEFKAPNMMTRLFASEISFKVLEPNQLPARFVGKEVDINGQKILYISKRIEDVSNNVKDITLDDWRLIVAAVVAPEEIPGMLEMQRLNDFLNGVNTRRR